MIRVVHIITDLSTGGAQMMLYKLLVGMDRSRFDPAVICLIDKGALGQRIEALDIPVYTVEMTQGKLSMLALWRLIKLTRLSAPDIIQGWMYHGNLAASIVRKFIVQNPLVLWNIRQTLYDIENEKSLTKLIIRLGRYFSSNADKIIYNSRISAQQHEVFGYRADTRMLLFNGFDVERFCPSEELRRSVRHALGLDETTFIVGLFARYHPMKDHRNFIQAANIVSTQQTNVHFILVGREVSLDNPALNDLISKTQLKNNFHLLGEREDVSDLMAAIDIAVTSSAWGEGFPNALGEAMASGLPCVVTDVGDSAFVLGDHGGVVPVRNSQALAAGVLQLLNLNKEDRRMIGERARQRIIDEFSLKKISSQYETMYEQVYMEHNARVN